MRQVNHVLPADLKSSGAQILLQELNQTLAEITGSSGNASFNAADLLGERATFVVAYDSAGQELGCGGLRPFNSEIAEIKRMYARPNTHGVGSAILQHLENQARAYGYRAIWLETRRINQRAVQFYLRHHYQVIANYGRYVGRDEAICFEKQLGEAQPNT